VLVGDGDDGEVGGVVVVDVHQVTDDAPVLVDLGKQHHDALHGVQGGTPFCVAAERVVGVEAFDGEVVHVAGQRRDCLPGRHRTRVVGRQRGSRRPSEGEGSGYSGYSQSAHHAPEYMSATLYAPPWSPSRSTRTRCWWPRRS